jgi:hypothetical protein
LIFQSALPRARGSRERYSLQPKKAARLGTDLKTDHLGASGGCNTFRFALPLWSAQRDDDCVAGSVELLAGGDFGAVPVVDASGDDATRLDGLDVIQTTRPSTIITPRTASSQTGVLAD